MKRPTTTSEDQSFAKAFQQYVNIDTGFILDWVEENFAPNEIYDEADLKDWITENYDAEDLFGSDVMEKWAEDHDYHQEDLGPDRIDE